MGEPPPEDRSVDFGIGQNGFHGLLHVCDGTALEDAGDGVGIMLAQETLQLPS